MRQILDQLKPKHMAIQKLAKDEVRPELYHKFKPITFGFWGNILVLSIISFMFAVWLPFSITMVLMRRKSDDK